MKCGYSPYVSGAWCSGSVTNVSHSSLFSNLGSVKDFPRRTPQMWLTLSNYFTQPLSDTDISTCFIKFDERREKIAETEIDLLIGTDVEPYAPTNPSSGR